MLVLIPLLTKKDNKIIFFLNVSITESFYFQKQLIYRMVIVVELHRPIEQMNQLRN